MGDNRAVVWWSAHVLIELGRDEDALGLVRPLADASDERGALQLAEVLVKLGRGEEALDLLRPLTRARNKQLLVDAAEMMIKLDRDEEALRCCVC